MPNVTVLTEPKILESGRHAAQHLEPDSHPRRIVQEVLRNVVLFDHCHIRHRRDALGVTTSAKHGPFDLADDFCHRCRILGILIGLRIVEDDEVRPEHFATGRRVLRATCRVDRLCFQHGTAADRIGNGRHDNLHRLPFDLGQAPVVRLRVHGLRLAAEPANRKARSREHPQQNRVVFQFLLHRLDDLLRGCRVGTVHRHVATVTVEHCPECRADGNRCLGKSAWQGLSQSATVKDRLLQVGNRGELVVAERLEASRLREALDEKAMEIVPTRVTQRRARAAW